MMVTVTVTRSKLYIIEYIVVFWLDDILVSTTTKWDGSYKKKGRWKGNIKECMDVTYFAQYWEIVRTILRGDKSQDCIRWR
jgi:hypothetical protein